MIRSPRFFILALGLLALTVPVVRAADLDPLLPADTESYVTINVRQIVDSELFKKQLLDTAKDALDKAGEATDVLKDLGFDPFKDLDRITFATPKSGDADRGLVIVHGKFDLDKFRKKADDAARDHDDILKKHKAPDGAGGTETIYEVTNPGHPALFVALLDKGTLVASPGKDYVVDAIKFTKVKKATALKNKDFQLLLEKLDRRQSVSMAVLGSSLKGEVIDSMPALKETLQKLEAVGASVTFDADIKMELSATAKKEDDATDLRDKMGNWLKAGQAALLLLGGEDKGINFATEVLKSLKVSGKGKVLSVRGKIAADLIEDALKKD
jgi:hypothetical protein